MSRAEFLATRRSLVERLADWNDRKRWQQFFDSYWKLIHRAARQAGLTESEAQEVVQETLITVAKKIDQLKYDPVIRIIQRLAPERYALADRRSF